MSEYKPGIIKSQFKRGPNGVGKVEIAPDKSKVRVTFKEKGDKYVVPMSECPENIRKGTWYVTLSEDKQKILGIRPASGVFTAKVISFPAPENQPPAPRIKTGSYEGKSFDYQYFISIIQLQDAEVKGMEVPVILRYNFGGVDEDGKNVVAFTHPKSKYTPQLIEFCDVTGVWNKGAMLYKDNILPTIMKRILHEARSFRVIIKNGFADSFVELEGAEPSAHKNDDESFGKPETETMPDDE